MWSDEPLARDGCNSSRARCWPEIDAQEGRPRLKALWIRPGPARGATGVAPVAGPQYRRLLTVVRHGNDHGLRQQATQRPTCPYTRSIPGWGDGGLWTRPWRRRRGDGGNGAFALHVLCPLFLFGPVSLFSRHSSIFLAAPSWLERNERHANLSVARRRARLLRQRSNRTWGRRGTLATSPVGIAQGRSLFGMYKKPRPRLRVRLCLCALTASMSAYQGNSAISKVDRADDSQAPLSATRARNRAGL